jgi:hypothetical protein
MKILQDECALVLRAQHMQASCVAKTRVELLEYISNLAEQVIAHSSPSPSPW